MFDTYFIFQSVCVFIVVIGVLIVGGRLFLGSRPWATSKGNKQLKIQETLYLNPKSKLMIVSWNQIDLLIGQDERGVTLLSQKSKENIP